MNARKEALEIIYKTIKESSYSNLLLRNRLNNYSSQDKSFITNLVYGVLKNYESLKYQFKDLFEKTSLRNEIILIMSLYEKYILNKKEYITINEYVEIGDNEYDKSFLNAILHRIDEYKVPDKEYIKHNIPEWIYNLLSKQYDSDELKNILNNYQKERITYYHINKNKCSFDDLKHLNINIIDDLFFTSNDNLIYTKEFNDGCFYIQDINSSLMINNLDLKTNDLFLDACSAPGSKLFNALDYIESKNAYSNDINETRVNLIKDKAILLGYNDINFTCLDASELSKNLHLKFNKILLDVPCSGLGVIGRRPDIKFHIKDTSLDELQLIQKDILEDASKLLLKDGLICYSTCTLNKKENTKQVNNFLNNHSDFSLVKEETLINDIGDMFYFAIIKRI